MSLHSEVGVRLVPTKQCGRPLCWGHTSKLRPSSRGTTVTLQPTVWMGVDGHRSLSLSWNWAVFACGEVGKTEFQVGGPQETPWPELDSRCRLSGRSLDSLEKLAGQAASVGSPGELATHNALSG